MSTENIDVVINPGVGARRVVRDINDIASAADNAATRLANLQRQINSLGSGSGLSQFQTQLTAVNTQLQSLNAQLNQMNGGIGRLNSGSAISGIGSLRSAIGGLMGALSVKTLMDWTDAWIAAQGKIRTLAPTMADATVVMEQLFQVAQRTRAPIEKLAQLYHFMTISAKDLGASQGDMLRVTETVSKLLAVQGTSFAQARGALLQLAQAFGTGRVRGQEFNSMLQNAPLLLSVVAKHVEGAHGSVSKLRQMMLEGKLSSKEFFDALLAGSQETDAMFSQAPKTFAQGFTVIRNAIEKYLGDVNQATGASQIFYDVMERLAGNIDNTARSLAVVGVVLLALPLGPIGVAIAGLAAYMAFFGEKTLVAKDGVTTLADIASVAWDDMKAKMLSVQLVLQDFSQKYLPEVSGSFADLGNVTFMDLVKVGNQTFDKILQAAVGGAYGVKAAFEGLPTVIDEIGKRMFNALTGWIEAMINRTIDGINKVAKFVGQDLLSHVSFEKAKIDQAAFQRYGQSVSNAVAEGVKSAGNPFEKNFNSMMDRAMVRGSQRVQEAFRRGEITNQNANLGARGIPFPANQKVNQKALNEDARNQMRELQEIFDRYKEQSAQMVEVERHKEVMLKASYDSGTIDFRTYITDLEQMQDESYQKQVELLQNTRGQLEKQYDSTFAALKRKGAKPQELDNFTKDFQTKVMALSDALDKLNNKQEETLANRTASKVKPLNDFVQNMEKAIALDDVNLKQEMEKIDAKKNINQLDERSLFIFQEIIRLQAPYEDALQKVQSQLQAAKDAGLYELDDSAVQSSIRNMEALADRLKTKIDDIKKTAPDALGAAFDAGKVDAFSKEFSRGIADALVEGGKEGGKKLRDVLQTELIKKPFAMVIQALIQPLGNILGQLVVGATQNMTSSIMDMFTGTKSSGNSNSLGGFGTGLGGGFGGFEDTVFNAGSTLNQNGFEGMGNFLMDNSEMVSNLGSGMGYLSAINSAANGKWGSAIGGAVGTFFGGPIGSMIGGTVGGMIDSAFGGGGGPKVESGAGTSYKGMGTSSGAASGIISGINSQWRQVAQQFGVTNTNLGLGAFVSQDPQGTAQTQLDVVSSTLGYSRGGRLGSTENAGRSEDELKQEVAAETTRILIMALQQSDLSAKIKNALGQIDLSSTADELQAQLEKILNAKVIEEQMTGLGQAFQFVSDMSVEAINRMADFGGGIQQFTSGLNSYLNNFFTGDERKTQIAGQIAASLNKDIGTQFSAGDISGMSRSTFRAMVEGVDKTTAWGQAAFGAFMKVAGSMAELTQETNNASSAQQELQSKIASLRNQLADAYQRERSEITQTMQSILTWRNSLTNFRQQLVQGSESPYTPQQKYDLAKSEYAGVVAALASSDPNARTDAQGRYESVAKDFLDSSKTLYASSTQYQSDFARVLDDMQKAQSQSDTAYQVAVNQLAALDQSVQGLIDVNTSVVSVRDAIYQLQTALAQQAAAAGAAAIPLPQTVPTITPGGGLAGQTAPVPAPYNPAGPTPIQTVTGPVGTGIFSGGYATGLVTDYPGGASGFNFIPENNYMARLHYGEAVLTRHDADIFRNVGLGGNLDPVTEGLAAVHKELTTLREQQEMATRAEMASNEAALDRNAQKVGDKVADSADRQSFKDRARARHRIA